MAMQTKHVAGLAMVAAAALQGGAAMAGLTESWPFQLPEQPLERFGMSHTIEYQGPAQGYVTSAFAELSFTAEPGFDAADIIWEFRTTTEGDPVWTFTGADLGWSGSGSFGGAPSTDVLNGPLQAPPPPGEQSTFTLTISAAGSQPLGGQFTNSLIVVHVAPGPPVNADLNADGVVDVNDLVIVIVNWGACLIDPAPCPGDTNNDDTVNVDDLVNVLLGWQ